MANISNTAIASVLAAFGQLVAPSLPAGYYVALCSATPSAGQTGATIPEITSAGSYARAAVTLGAPSGGASANTGVVNFPTSTAAYSATVTAIAVLDSATIGAGNLWYWATLTGSITISAANNIVSFAIGQISVSVS